MDWLKPLAAIAVAVVGVTVVGGGASLLVGIGSPPSVASVATVVLVAAVIGLAILAGTRGSGWIDTPYW